MSVPSLHYIGKNLRRHEIFMIDTYLSIHTYDTYVHIYMHTHTHI